MFLKLKKEEKQKKSSVTTNDNVFSEGKANKKFKIFKSLMP